MSNSGDDSQVWEMPGAGRGSGVGLAGMDAGGDGGSGYPCPRQPWRERPPAHDSQHRWDAEMYCSALGFCDVLLSRAAVNRLKKNNLKPWENAEIRLQYRRSYKSVSQKLTFFTWFFFPCNFPLENKISWFFNLKYSCFLSLPLQSPSKWENLEMGHERGKPVVH